MLAVPVRDPDLEGRVYALLNEDTNKIWSVSSLTRQLAVPRLRVERAVLVLQVQNKVVIEKPIGNTLVVRLPPSGEGNGAAKKPKSRGPDA